MPADPDVRSPDNRRAALYEIRTGEGDWNMITVRVRPEGVADGPPPDAVGEPPQGPFAKVAFHIRNDWRSAVDLPVDEVRLTARTEEKGGSDVSTQPVGTPGAARVLPGDEKTVVLFLPLPAEPEDIASYELRWGLRSGEKSYRQATTFVRDREDDRSYVYVPYYDPFWYGYSGYRSPGRGWRSGLSIGVGVSN